MADETRKQKRELRRIAVVGTSCSGKTTFARQLSGAVGAPHIELDTLFWQPDWVKRPRAEFRQLVAGATAAERWVVDGNYSSVRDLVWRRATVVVWLNYPLATVFSRAVRRTVRRAVTREELFAGNRETLRRSFLSRDSILLWVLQTFWRNRSRYAALRASADWQHLRFIELRSSALAAAFLSRCAAHGGAASSSPCRDLVP